MPPVTMSLPPDEVSAARGAGCRTRNGSRRISKLASAEVWQPLLEGIDAVVNCVGVLQDGLRDDVRRVQLDGTKALFDGCVRAGVKRVIHISAIGAEPDGPSAFSRSKAGAEAYLKELPLDWVILRPALVLGPAAYGGTAMLRGIAAFPGVVPVVRAERASRSSGWTILPKPSRSRWRRKRRPDRVGGCAPEGAPPRRYRDRDPRLARLSAAGRADAAGCVRKSGGGSRRRARLSRLAQPRALDLAGQLTAGVIGDPARWMAETGIAPKSLDQILAARRANVQDRWFARLYC